MSFTRFHDDNCRIEKQLQELTGTGRYIVKHTRSRKKPLFYGGSIFKITILGC